jgi:alkylated DNA repair dioxygenase AlkB
VSSYDFTPDNCQIYKFEQGDSLQLSVLDKSQKNLDSPAIMITLGGKATHLIEGLTQTDDLGEVELYNGDVLVFSGQPRFQQFGVQEITGKKQAMLWLRQVC